MTKGKTYCKGGQTRTAICPECERQFRGTPRFVNKLIRLHNAKTHGRIVKPPAYHATNSKASTNNASANKTCVPSLVVSNESPDPVTL